VIGLIGKHHLDHRYCLRRHSSIAFALEREVEIRSHNEHRRNALEFFMQSDAPANCNLISGNAALEGRGKHSLGPADAFVIPPGEPWTIAGASGDFRLLQVTTATLD